MAEVIEKTKHLFKSSLQNCRYLFKDGKTAVFYSGEFLTDIQSEIDELNEEIASGHPFIYKEAGRETIIVSNEDPIEAIKRKAIEEFKAQQAAALNGEESTSDQKFNIAGISNSKSVGDAMSGSTSSEGAAPQASEAGAKVMGSVNTGSGTASVMAAKLAQLKGQA